MGGGGSGTLPEHVHYDPPRVLLPAVKCIRTFIPKCNNDGSFKKEGLTFGVNTWNDPEKRKVVKSGGFKRKVRKGKVLMLNLIGGSGGY